jgi:hypothetical protein
VDDVLRLIRHRLPAAPRDVMQHGGGIIICDRDERPLIPAVDTPMRCNVWRAFCPVRTVVSLAAK